MVSIIHIFALNIVLCIVASAPIAPLSNRQATKQSQATIVQTIIAWQDDVNTLNSLLNSVLLSPTPSQVASVARGVAVDETSQLDTLVSFLPANSPGFVAAQKLESGQRTVLAGLAQIAINGGDSATISSVVASINVARCSKVLPNVGIIFNAALTGNQLPAVPFPPGPAACPIFDAAIQEYALQ